MKITIILFGIIRDIIGESKLTLELKKESSIEQLKQYLIKEYNELSKYHNFSIAVNEEYVEAGYILKSNDIVALIPPVSGG